MEPPAGTTCAAVTLKRVFDAFFSAAGLVLLSPLFLFIALAIKLADRGPVFYRQVRIGQYRIPFRIWKFRTMVPEADQCGLPVTGEGDKRVTRIGRILRRSKLDELPQLLNVLKGEMSLVGPRPEVARYVACYTPEQQEILQSKPGVTDLATLCFRDEEALLQSSSDTELFYIQHCLPRKLKLNQEYALKANLLTDTWIILRTVCPYWFGVLGLYAAVLGLGFWLAEILASNFAFGQNGWTRLLRQTPVVVGTQLVCLLARRHCAGLLCYFGMPELRQVASGLLQATLLLLVLSLSMGDMWPAPNVLLINLCTAFLLLCGLRISLRLWRERSEDSQASTNVPQLRVGIVGAGSLGAGLACCLSAQKNLGRTAVVFFDDDFGKWQKQIHGIPVVGMPECLLQGWAEKLDEVVIALPNASPSRLHQIYQIFENKKLAVYRAGWPVPGLPEPDSQVAVVA